MGKRSASCADHDSGQPPYQPPADGGDGGDLLDLSHLGNLIPQFAGTVGLGVSGFGDTSGPDAILAAHAGLADGPGINVSLIGDTDLGGSSGLLGGMDGVDHSCLLDTILGDCGLI